VGGTSSTGVSEDGRRQQDGGMSENEEWMIKGRLRCNSTGETRNDKA
jgi:hypothetical protein